MSEEQTEEVIRRMRDMIKNKKKDKEEDSILTLDDGTELKIGYAEDE